MAAGQNTQLEKVIDEVLKSGDVHALGVYLQGDLNKGTPLRCSQQFLNKLDKLVQKCLDQQDSKSARLGLAIIHKCGVNLKLPGRGQGLSGIIGQGLVNKWFEKCRQLWIQRGPQFDEALLNLSEDFFDALMVVHEESIDGTYKITESFLYPVGQLGIDLRIEILIRREAIRKFNLILDKIPGELKKKRNILTSQEASYIMIKLADQMLDCGDYDLQTALMEALCRMASPIQRKNLAHQLFSMEHVASAFSKILDSEFETDCRKFLNLVNGMQGDRRRVYSYPCLEVYLDRYKLLMPPDEKLEEFWIDFNLGSHSISFYFSLSDEEGQDGKWETICIHENEVQSYTVTEEGKRKVLELKLSEGVVVGVVEGSNLTVDFNSSLEVLEAARSVYGHSKYKGFIKKRGTSVVKTTVKIIMEENSSQVVPESQVSLVESEKTTAPCIVPAPAAPVQMVTPGKRRISESTTFIHNTSGRSVHGASFLSAVKPSSTTVKGKKKMKVYSSDRQVEPQLGEPWTTANTPSHGTTPSTTPAGGMAEKSYQSLQGPASKRVKNNAEKYKKNIHLEKAADVVLSGKGEEQYLDNEVVPDTQPTTPRNISSNWKKCSVSEMIMMPTQKISALPRFEHHSSLGQMQECQSLAQRVSVPSSGPISRNRLHGELTQRLQQVLNEKKQDCASPEPTAAQGNMSNIRGYSKSRSSAEQGPSIVQQAQKISLAKRETKGHVRSGEADAAPNNAPVKAPTTKALPRSLTDVKGKTCRALSSKEKRDAVVAGSMVKLISTHYETKTQSTAKHIYQSKISPVKRPFFNMSSLATAKQKKVSGDVVLNKSHGKTETKSARNDIFAFTINTPLTIEGKGKLSKNASAILSSDINDSVSHCTTMKGNTVTKEKRYVKKHLFSDTHTDDDTTEVSWLKESTRKPKPKVTKYTRQAPRKPKAVSPHTSCEFSDLRSPSPKPAMGNRKPTKKEHNVKERVAQPNSMKPAPEPKSRQAAGRRPRRAAATSTKSYKEPDTDDSQSLTEEPSKPKRYSSPAKLGVTHHAVEMKRMSDGKKITKSYMKLESSHHSSHLESMSDQLSTSKQQRPEKILEETSKLYKENVVHVREHMQARKDSSAARQTSSCSSPPFIERMRSAERSAPTVGLTCSPLLTPWGSPLPASPDAAFQDTPSPVLLIPKPRSTVSSNGKVKSLSYSSAGKKRTASRTQSVRSAITLPSIGHQNPAPSPPIGLRATEISQNLQCTSPATESPLCLSTQRLLTSAVYGLDRPPVTSPAQSPFPEDIVHLGSLYGYSKVSSLSEVSISQSSTKSLVLMTRVKDSPSVVCLATEFTPLSDEDVKPAQLLVSGPSRKRHISLSSDSDEDEKEKKWKKSKMRGQRSPQLKPRKLFNAFKELCAEGEDSQLMSSSRAVTSYQWVAEGGGGNTDEDLELPINPSNLCQQFSADLKEKFQNRYKMVDVYNKQSLNTVQQHVSCLNVEVSKYRTQRLEQVQKVLLDEINKLEKGDVMLKSMEKDLTIYWKKQTVALRSYQEQETRSNETLKKALQSNMGPSLEYEQRIFTSQMCLIRKDMKSVQDRLLCEMREGEIKSVKRGLHSLFFPDGSRF